MAEIKVTLLSKTKLELKEKGDVGDTIDINNIPNTLDQSTIDDIFQKIKNDKMEETINKRVEEKLQNFEAQKKLQIADAINKTEKILNASIAEQRQHSLIEIQQLKSTIDKLNETIKHEQDLKTKDLEIEKVKLEQQYEHINQKLKDEIDKKDKEINELKNKERWSNFQDWENFPDGGLENYCYNYYLNHIKKFLPHIEFVKDTKLIENTKGDFILREKQDNGFDFSISFEMKNEKKNNIKGKKIRDHYPQANLNRNKKGCKYSVIVTTLEPETQFNIRKIDEYDNMWICRPEFFEDIITELRDKEYGIFEETLRLKELLVIAKSENQEIDKFNVRLNKAKESWTKHYTKANTKLNDAIEEIDKTIKELNKVRESLLTSNQQLSNANSDMDNLTIKKLTHGAPSVAKLLQNNEDEEN